MLVSVEMASSTWERPSYAVLNPEPQNPVRMKAEIEKVVRNAATHLIAKELPDRLPILPDFNHGDLKFEAASADIAEGLLLASRETSLGKTKPLGSTSYEKGDSVNHAPFPLNADLDILKSVLASHEKTVASRSFPKAYYQNSGPRGVLNSNSRYVEKYGSSLLVSVDCGSSSSENLKTPSATAGTTKIVKNKCSCNRPKAKIMCLECGTFFDGRVQTSCPAHPRRIGLMDFNNCINCRGIQIFECKGRTTN